MKSDAFSDHSVPVLGSLTKQVQASRPQVADAALESTLKEYYSYDPDFQLRGTFDNVMVDAAMPLFGLSMRLSTLNDYEHINKLYDDVSNQIRLIVEEIRQRDYDDVSVKAFSYALCLFMDEAVMRRPWGISSEWSRTSLLSEFHKETWGGEKFFTLLERMSSEASKYRDVLELMYFCVCLGLKGKYKVQANGDEALQKIIVRLQRLLRELRGPLPSQLSDPLGNVAPRHLRLARQWPWWSPWIVASALLMAIYTTYSIRLDMKSQEVLKTLDHILKL